MNDVTPQAPPDSRAAVGRRVERAIAETGRAQVTAGALDLPDLPGLPPCGITLSQDRIVAHLRLSSLPVAAAADEVAAAIGAALEGTPWEGSTVELHVDDLTPEALPHP